MTVQQLLDYVDMVPPPSERSVSIHLIDDVVAEKRRHRRAFLVFLLVSAGVGLFFSLSVFLSDYCANPYVVTTKIIRPNSYPPLAFCPGFTADLDKLAKHGLTVEHYFDLTGYFWQSYDVSVLENMLRRNQLDKSHMVKITADVQEFLSTNKLSILDAMLELSVSAEDIVSTNVPDSYMTNVSANSFRPWFTAYGLCFLVEFNVHGMDEFIASFSEASFGINQISYPNDEDWGFFPRTDFLFVGERVRANFPSPVYHLPRDGFRANIMIRGTHMRRHKDCVDIGYEEHMECLMECMNENCLANNECSINTGIGYVNLTERSCNLVRNESCTGIQDPALGTRCAGRCPQICSEWIHELSIFPLPTKRLNLTYLSFSYVGALSAYSLEERYIYTWHGFLAGVGGQLSLWCGMSVLSIPQVVLYLWDYSFGRYLRRQWAEKKANQAWKY